MPAPLAMAVTQQREPQPLASVTWGPQTVLPHSGDLTGRPSRRGYCGGVGRALRTTTTVRGPSGPCEATGSTACSSPPSSWIARRAASTSASGRAPCAFHCRYWAHTASATSRKGWLHHLKFEAIRSRAPSAVLRHSMSATWLWAHRTLLTCMSPHEASQR